MSNENSGIDWEYVRAKLEDKCTRDYVIHEAWVAKDYSGDWFAYTKEPGFAPACRSWDIPMGLDSAAYVPRVTARIPNEYIGYAYTVDADPMESLVHHVYDDVEGKEPTKINNLWMNWESDDAEVEVHNDGNALSIVLRTDTSEIEMTENQYNFLVQSVEKFRTIYHDSTGGDR